MPYTKEEARLKIQKLVEDFRAHEATLEHAPEAQIENNFIRPLFRYLNWNTENEGLSHAHYEFKVQVTNKKGLRPDYILNLDGRDVLVMDAKQVKYSMRDPRWLYQVYSYAYSTQNSKPSEKIDFAILTDFQEFIVLDCTLFAAKPEAVNNFRVIDWKYSDYVDKFDELWELFERNNVLNDSRSPVIASRTLAKQSPTDEGIASAEERRLAMTRRGLWSRYLSPQKVKANRIAPDKAFLAQMDNEKNGWRVLLAKDMKKRNPSADGELITAAVQLLIDRLIFVKALSDREVDRDYLSEIKDRVTEAGLGTEDAGWFKSCKTIFDELNNFYNGSIFQERLELENVTVSNKVVRSVITDLQPENSPYNFAVLPVEILGTIYERFLGRVVRTTEKQVKIEEKPEVRKAGGVYYTPQYIVEYIVENTLGKLLEECKSPADVAKLKILDPACGSGSFLLGAYNALIAWHKDYFARVTQIANLRHKNRNNFYVDESGQIRLTAKLKRDILKNNLFGVDIDPQAVEVTRFSLSLKALEDLREGELTEERTLFHQTVLPDLSQNIKNGNSLIGTDYFGLFAPTSEELKEVKPFNWKAEFKEIMENGGFDAVIGNPPYVLLQTLEQPSIFQYLSNKYKSATYKIDTYAVFMEKGISLTKLKGAFGYITPNTFLKNKFALELRKLILESGNINSLRVFYYDVFDGASVDTSIITLTKLGNPSPDNQVAVIRSNSPSEENDSIPQLQQIWKEHPSKFFVLPSSNESDAIITKIDSDSIRLGEFATAYFGIQTFDRTRYVNSKRVANSYKPVIDGANILRYGLLESKEFVEFLPQAIKSGGKKDVYEQKRIGVRQIGEVPIPTILPAQLYTLNTIYNIYFTKATEFSLEFVLGVIASKLIGWFWKKSFFDEKRTFPKIKKEALLSIPLPKLDFTNPAEKSQHDKMVALVSQMLELHKSKSGAKTQFAQEVYERQIRAVDEQIDSLVYELYGLNEEEIGIVEGK
jgi:type I restriction-modification system DNA methylase subunit